MRQPDDGWLSGIAPGVLAYVRASRSWLAGNVGALVGRTSMVLVDTAATGARTQAILDALRARCGDLPVGAVINTHHHPGQTLGNGTLPPTATVVGHRHCREEMLRYGTDAADLFPGVVVPDEELADAPMSPPTLTFDDSLTLHVADTEVELRFVGPAHTRGDIVVWVPEYRVVFAGDLVTHRAHPNLLDGTIGGYPAALRRLRSLDARVVVPGRGPACGPEVVDDMLAYAEFVADLAADGFERGRTPLEVAGDVPPGRFASWQDTERLVANLHRAYAELRGEPACAPLDRGRVLEDVAKCHGGPLEFGA